MYPPQIDVAMISNRERAATKMPAVVPLGGWRLFSAGPHCREGEETRSDSFRNPQIVHPIPASHPAGIRDFLFVLPNCCQQLHRFAGRWFPSSHFSVDRVVKTAKFEARRSVSIGTYRFSNRRPESGALPASPSPYVALVS